MPTQTTVFNLNKPTVAGDPDTWGGSAGLNGSLDKLEAALKATATTGSANAYVLSSGLSLTAYATGLTLRIIPNFTNSGAATINVDGLGAKSITKLGATAVASGDITSGRIYTLSYDGTQFQIVEINALDPTLSTIAALTPTTDQSIYFTGSDTAATYSLTSAGRSMASAASATAQTALLNEFTGDSGSGGLKGLVKAPIAGDSGKYLKGDGTWSTLNPAISWGAPVATWTWSTNVTEIAFTGLSAYSELLIIAYDVTTASSVAIQLQWSIDNGSTYISTSTYGRSGGATTSASVRFTAATASAYVVHILNFNTASYPSTAISLMDAGTSPMLSVDTTLRAKNAFKILNSGTANFTAGTIRVYGKA